MLLMKDSFEICLPCLVPLFLVTWAKLILDYEYMLLK